MEFKMCHYLGRYCKEKLQTGKYEHFSTAADWLKRFKDRHNIVCKTIYGESEKADRAKMTKWVADNMYSSSK